jgi:hypothetical protein
MREQYDSIVYINVGGKLEKMNKRIYIKLIVIFLLLTIYLNSFGQKNENDIFSNKKKFENFIYTNIHYPLIDFVNNVEGSAVYKFELDSIYKVYQLNIVHSSGSNTLDIEGKRLLYSIPRQDNQYPKNEISVDFKIADNKIYRISEVLDNPPEFPGGNTEMLNFISRNLQLPPEIAESSIQGIIICGFIVEKDGSIETVEIIKPLYRYVDAEAMRVIKRMPKWKTGEINGKPVRVYCIVPIKIEPT